MPYTVAAARSRHGVAFRGTLAQQVRWSSPLAIHGSDDQFHPTERPSIVAPVMTKGTAYDRRCSVFCSVIFASYTISGLFGGYVIDCLSEVVLRWRMLVWSVFCGLTAIAQLHAGDDLSDNLRDRESRCHQ